MVLILSLTIKNNNLSKEAIYWYKRVKNVFDKEYIIQQSTKEDF